MSSSVAEILAEINDEQPESNVLRADRAEITKTIALLRESGAVYEVRAKDVNISTTVKPFATTVSGYFLDRRSMVNDIIKLAALNPPAIWLSINPCISACWGRAKNRVDMRAKHATTDGEIAKRLILMLDFDAWKPIADVSATDAEHDDAIAGRGSAAST